MTPGTGAPPLIASAMQNQYVKECPELNKPSMGREKAALMIERPTNIIFLYNIATESCLELWVKKFKSWLKR
jgi:hypothetical protein